MHCSLIWNSDNKWLVKWQFPFYRVIVGQGSRSLHLWNETHLWCVLFPAKKSLLNYLPPSHKSINSSKICQCYLEQTFNCGWPNGCSLWMVYIPFSLYKVQVLGNIWEVTTGRKLLVITQVSSGLKKFSIFSSLANISTFMLRWLV